MDWEWRERLIQSENNKIYKKTYVSECLFTYNNIIYSRLDEHINKNSFLE